jgi:glycosyltransferase involved in cell wall biosynthesis
MEIREYMGRPKISVIAPVYNTEKYLRQCLDSIVNQTLKDIEIICINDGSTDSSLDILMEYASKDTRVSVINQKHCAMAGVIRNKGIEIARGEYICFMDSDDFYPNDKALFNLYATAKEKNVFLCGGSLSFCNGEGKSIKNNFQESIFTQNQSIKCQKYDCDFYYFRFIYSARLLKDNDLYFPQYRSYEDPTWLIKVMIYSKNFYAIKDTVYCYRINYKDRMYNFLVVSDILKSLKLSLELTKKNNYKNLMAIIIKRINSDTLLGVFKNAVKENSDIGIYIKDVLSTLIFSKLIRFNDFYLPYMPKLSRVVKKVNNFLANRVLCIKNEGINKVIVLFGLKIKIKLKRLVLRQELTWKLDQQRQELTQSRRELTQAKQEIAQIMLELTQTRQEITTNARLLRQLYSRVYDPNIELDAKNFH